MPMYNLIKFTNNHSKTSGSLRQCCRDEPNNVITEPQLYKYKPKFLNNTNNGGTINGKIIVPLNT